VDGLAFSMINSSAMPAKPSPSSVLGVNGWGLLREGISIASKCHPLFVQRGQSTNGWMDGLRAHIKPRMGCSGDARRPPEPSSPPKVLGT